MNDELYMNRKTFELHKLINIRGNNVHLSKLASCNSYIIEDQSIYMHLTYFKIHYFTVTTSDIINFILDLLNDYN